MESSRSQFSWALSDVGVSNTDCVLSPFLSNLYTQMAAERRQLLCWVLLTLFQGAELDLAWFLLTNVLKNYKKYTGLIFRKKCVKPHRSLFHWNEVDVSKTSYLAWSGSVPFDPQWTTKPAKSTAAVLRSCSPWRSVTQLYVCFVSVWWRVSLVWLFDLLPEASAVFQRSALT